MTDLLDKAQATEEQFRRDAIKASRPQNNKKSNGICIDCNEAINALRHQKNPYALRCIDCQTLKEKRNHRRG